ncbi:MAG: hypothetical protein WCA64_12235 [Gallionella sp.]
MAESAFPTMNTLPVLLQCGNTACPDNLPFVTVYTVRHPDMTAHSEIKLIMIPAVLKIRENDCRQMALSAGNDRD